MINPKHPMAELLEQHPRLAQALEGSLARQESQRQARRDEQTALLRVATATCPHCGADGIKYLTLGQGEQARDYYRRREDCCQPAIRDAALKALHYAMHPHGVLAEQEEAAARYTELRAAVTDLTLLSELEAHERQLAGIAERIIGLHSAQGGSK